MNGRPYRGMSSEERLADRRERLMAAAYTLYCDPGFPETTIERLCAAARISNRAFYECFSGREELMEAVHDRCVQESLASVAKSVAQAPDSLLERIRAGIGGYIGYVTEDRRRARLMHLEVRRAGGCLTKAREQALAGFFEAVEIISPGDPALAGPAGNDRRLLALGVIGAIQELLTEWVLADDPPEVDHLIDAAVRVFHRAFVA